MKHLFKTMAFIAFTALTVVSCKKDDSIADENKTITNTELITVLKAKGFTIDGNQFLVDGKVRDTKSLDLSGSNLSNIAGLEVFPNLEEVNLSNNNFGDTFDFAQLPQTVTSVNLADNDIYKYKGLATVSDKGFAVQKQLKKLVLPASARFNVDLLPYYYKETKGKTTLQMQNPETKAIEDYTTLRNIPDENVRNYIKGAFPSLMKGEQIDLLADLGGSSATDVLFRGDVSSFEGLQYIINNPQWRGVQIAILTNKGVLPYIKVPKTLQVIVLLNIDTPYLDMSKAEEIRYLQLNNNPSIEIADFSHSKRFMKRPSSEQINQDNRYGMILINCPNLKEIKLADDIKESALHSVGLVNLPKLKEFDMTKINGLNHFYFGKLPNTKLTLPKELTYNIETDTHIYISITEDMITDTKAKDFILKYNKLKDKKGYFLLDRRWNDLRFYTTEEKAVNYRELWGLTD